jgi:hypothetical protein
MAILAEIGSGPCVADDAPLGVGDVEGEAKKANQRGVGFWHPASHSPGFRSVARQG